MSASFSRREALATGLASTMLAANAPLASASASPGLANADDAVQRIIQDFGIPGVALGIFRRNTPDLIRCFGVRRLGAPDPIDADTQFAIASNSKSFTAAAIALLVDQGKLAWDAPVISYMPDFAMADPIATQSMTVRDLLCHRSGLPLGAGDLLQFPTTDHARNDFLTALRFLKPARGFRSGYDYDNILYVVAGILIERISGMSWERFVTERLLRPAGMSRAVANRTLITSRNVAARHARLGPPIRGMGAMALVDPDESIAAAPAGGIQASITDVGRWIVTQLGHGETPSGTRLWNEAQTAEMWNPQVITTSSAGPTTDNPARPVISTYALGWFVTDYRGHRLVGHSGGLSGQVTHMAILPDLGVGVAVLTNIESHIAAPCLRNVLLDVVLDVTTTDWPTIARQQRDAEQADAIKALGGSQVVAPPGGPSLPLDAYTGRYRDPWYGDIVITRIDSRLHIDFTRTPVFKSILEPFGAESFRTRFAPTAGEDAVVTFVMADGRPTRLRLHALSPLADFSYDFQHLDPVRVA